MRREPEEFVFLVRTSAVHYFRLLVVYSGAKSLYLFCGSSQVHVLCFDGFRSSGTQLDERVDLSGEKAKSRRAWRLGDLALDYVRGRGAAALSLSLSSVDINTYFSPLTADGPPASPAP